MLFTALPLAGATRGFSTLTIGVAIALMSMAEIVVLTVAYRVLDRIGLVAVLAVSLVLGCGCAALLAAFDTQPAYLGVSLVFGCALAGVTVGLPLVAIGIVGESTSGLAWFRISAGIGMLGGSVGCAVLGTVAGAGPLFTVVAVVLAAGVLLVRDPRHSSELPA